MKIGVFGGTFDPVHTGHIRLVQKALSELELDFLYVIPNGAPPHKTNRTEKEHRLAMTKLAFSGVENVCVCDYEIKKESYSYTYETLSYLKEKHPDAKLYFLMGMDNLTEFFSWKKPEQICALSTLVFFGRENYPWDENAVLRLQEEYGARICRIAFSEEISSTELRNEINRGSYLFDKIPCDVFCYLIRHGLYGLTPVGEFDFYFEELKNYIEDKRYRHSIGVAVTAYLLALRYGEDEKLAYFAGLLHDIAKRMPFDKQIALCEQIKLHPDEIQYPKMLHAPAGSEFVRKTYRIQNEKLLRAIRLHTMGDPDMTLFDKIIYMADYIEPCRDFDGVEALRNITFENIDHAIIQGIDLTICSLIEDRLKISPVLLDVRNGLLEQEKKGN